MIGAELRFKSVRGMAKRRGHHSRISDDDIEHFTLCQQSIRASSHALQIAEIEMSHLETAAVSRSVPLPLCGRRFRLAQVPRRTDDHRAVRGKGSCSLNSESGRNACHKYPLPAKINPGQ